MDRSTNGTYVNGIKVQSGVPVQLCPDDHINLLQRDNASDSRPNIGFRIIMALEKPKIGEHYSILEGGILGTYFPCYCTMLTVGGHSVQSIKHAISKAIKSSPSKSSVLSAAQV